MALLIMVGSNKFMPNDEIVYLVVDVNIVLGIFILNICVLCI
jgi:hypothetical protein